MNENSVICKFIDEHPDDWEELLKGYELRIKKDGDLAIFNYVAAADFFNPIVQEARGIIVDTVKKEVVCWPFRKFGNHNEGYADKIDWSSARVLQKVDGSIIKLWFDKSKGAWQFSTNGTIRAENANVDGMLGLTYGAVILQADNYGDIPFDKLDKDSTYIFELVSPETRIVIKYDCASLYHLGTRNNVTGQEYEADIGIKKPKSYPLTSLKDCVDASIELNKATADTNEIENEGFVVVDKYYRRVKIKSPDYIMSHHLATQKSMPKRECVQVLLYERERLNAIYEKCPEVIPELKFYDYHIAELINQADKMGVLALSLFKEYDGDRGAVASVIGSHRLAFAGFHCISHSGVKGSDAFKKMEFGKFCRFLPDYEPEDLTALFKKKVDGDGEN